MDPEDIRIKADFIARRNIEALRVQRHMSQEDLAHFVGIRARAGRALSAGTISRMLKSKDPRKADRGIKLTYLDAFAEALGCETYQLLVPGVAELTERRSGRDRRSMADRRVSAKIRLERQTLADVSSATHTGQSGARAEGRSIAQVAEALKQAVEAMHTIARVAPNLDRQLEAARRKRPKPTKGRRTAS